MKPRKSFLLRLSPDLYEALEALAQQEFRSVNGQIEYLLRESLTRHSRPLASDDSPAPPGEPPKLPRKRPDAR